MSEKGEEPAKAGERASASHPSLAARVSSLIQQHIPLVVTGVLGLIVALHVGLASGFEGSIARALLSSGSTVQVLMGIAVSLLPLMLFAIAIFGAALGGRALRRAVVAKDWSTVVILCLVGVFFLLVFAILLPWWELLVIVALLPVGFVIPWKGAV